MESGIQPIVAAQELTPGARLDEKVRRLIASSHVVMVVLTEEGIRSSWVQQEIGFARARRTVIVPLVTRGVRLPAMLGGHEYFRFKKSDPTDGFRRIAGWLCEFAEKEGLALGIGVQIPDDEFRILHLSHAMLCPNCRNVDLHVFLCLLCGDWICTNCGTTIPASSRAVSPKTSKS